MRWTAQKSERFQALRDREAQGWLTEADRVVLDGLLADLDADEAEALRPADERLDAQARAMDAERAELDVKAGELERIAREEETLLAEARTYVARLRQRSAALSRGLPAGDGALDRVSAVTDRRRERARERFGGRCAYCGVHEEAVGATLTVDHHQPAHSTASSLSWAPAREALRPLQR